MIILAGVADADGEIVSESFYVNGDAVLLLPASYGEDTLALDDAVGAVQVQLPDGSWIDYADGSDGEQIAAAGVKAFHSPGLKHRVRFTGADGDTEIPILTVSGPVSIGGDASAWTPAAE